MTDLNTLSLPGASLIAVIRDDAEALEIANRLAEGFAKTAPYRDRERRLPFAELDRFSNPAFGPSRCQPHSVVRTSPIKPLRK